MPDFTRILAFAAAITALSTLDAHAANTDPWNPRVASDDVVLPMPCGASMAFRKVVTSAVEDDPADSLLDDRRVVLGRAVEETGYVEYSRIDHIAGSFVDAGERYFLLGKYEVEEGQYEAVMSGGTKCPARDFEDSLPKTSIGWFDAVEFTRRYTLWLYQQNLAALPSIHGVSGYVRLPTETEWEFAARGGISVSETDFQKNIFAAAGELGDYAWFAGASSSDGELQPIGSVMKPNPLGFYDMLGNASEMVLDPFRLNRAGRLHGQFGGFIAKGGSIRTPRQELRTSLREELAYFNPSTKDETRVSSMGFRVAVSGIAMPDLSSINALKASWNAALGVTETVDNPISSLRVLAEEQSDIRLRNSLDSIRQQFARDRSAAREQARLMLHNILLSLTSMQDRLLKLLNEFNQIAELKRHYEANLESAAKGGEYLRTEIAKFRQEKERTAGAFLEVGEVYVDILTQLNVGYSEEEILDELRLLNADLLQSNRRALAGVVNDLLAAIRVSRTIRNEDKMKTLEGVFGTLNFYEDE